MHCWIVYKTSFHPYRTSGTGSGKGFLPTEKFSLIFSLSLLKGFTYDMLRYKNRTPPNDFNCKRRGWFTFYGYIIDLMLWHILLLIVKIHIGNNKILIGNKRFKVFKSTWFAVSLDKRTLHTWAEIETKPLISIYIQHFFPFF